MRQLQSIQMSACNPIKNSIYKEKSIFNRASRGNSVCNGSPIGIKCLYNGMTFRSLNEFLFYMMCTANGLTVEYEPHEYCIKWFNSERGFLTTYLPDFYINGYVIELKNCKWDLNKAIAQDKYIKVGKAYQRAGIRYIITYPDKYFIDNGCDKVDIFKIRDDAKKTYKEISR